MKNSNLIIRVPEPCHEDWSQMLPDAKGKFCTSCNKSVFDFSTKTDSEIKDILVEHKNQKVCGHFKKSQIDRPLNISINLRDLPRNVNITKAFAIALFIVFGTFLFSCTNEQGQKVETIETLMPSKEEISIGGAEFFIPPVNLDTTTNVEKINLIGETVCSVTSGAVSVEGMMEVEELPVWNEELIIADSVVKDEPIIDDLIVGDMVFYSEEKTDTTIVDHTGSTSTQRIEHMQADDVLSKTTNFAVYPNPSAGDFTIRYDVTKRADVSLVIYDLKGILVRSLVNVHAQYEGKYHIPVNLNELPNGIYIVSLIIGDKKSTERVVIER